MVGKLKTIFEILAEIGNKMVDTLNKMIEENQPVPAKDICARFTTDAIASVAFGLECNSLKEPNHIFRFGYNIQLNLDCKNTFVG